MVRIRTLRNKRLQDRATIAATHDDLPDPHGGCMYLLPLSRRRTMATLLPNLAEARSIDVARRVTEKRGATLYSKQGD